MTYNIITETDQSIVVGIYSQRKARRKYSGGVSSGDCSSEEAV